MSNVKLKGKIGSIRIRLPDWFYDEIMGVTTCDVLGIMIVDKVDNTTVAGSPNSAGNSGGRSAENSKSEKPPSRRHLQGGENTIEVGKLNALRGNLLYGFILSCVKTKPNIFDPPISTLKCTTKALWLLSPSCEKQRLAQAHRNHH